MWSGEQIAAGEVPEEMDAVAGEDVEEIEPELDDLADEEDVDLPAEPGAAPEEEDDSEW